MRLLKPTAKTSNSPIDEELFLRAARAYALKRFPNPDRKGCLTPEEIGSIARREMSFSAIRGRAEHLATCSPCFSEYLAARGRWKRGRRYAVAILAAAASLAIVITGVTWVSSPLPPSSPTAPPVVELDRPGAQLPQPATLDLRPFDASRGNPRSPASIPILARANLKLTVLLPAGSDEGSYDFEVRDDQSAPLVKGSGVAVIRNYVTRIETTIDLRSLSPGQFIWAVRRAGESSWRLYRLKVV